jgi:hypothetical protein
MVVGALVLAAAVGVPTALLVRGTGPAPVGSTSPRPTPSPAPGAAQARALYQKLLTATERSPGFHYVAVSSGPGVAETITGDAGQRDGTQVIRESSSCGSEAFTLRLTPDQSLYFQGNGPALADQLGVTGSTAASLAGRWVLVTLGEGPYTQLAEGITVTSQLQSETFVPSAVQTVREPGGGSATRISGTVPPTSNAPIPARASFEVPSGAQFPSVYAQIATADGQTFSTRVTFSDWGTAPAVVAPASPVAWSSLGASPPAGGDYGQGCGSPSGSPSPTPTPTPGPGSI